MFFSKDEIDTAILLHRAGLPWQPQAGHFVFDWNDRVRRSSPFQDRVFFVLNHDHFMRLLGGVERFRSQMVWLPLWEDMRQMLRQRGVPDEEVERQLLKTNALRTNALREGNERLVLYQLLLSSLTTEATLPTSAPLLQETKHIDE